MSLSGLKTAVRYSLPSCRLGFCGPRDRESQKILHDFASGKKIEEEKVRKILSSFEGMYPYLCLIAAKNDISDPLDECVVRALWIGSSLLEKVTKEDLRGLILNDFAKPILLSLAEAEERAGRVKDGMVPHHSFHVFVLGSITGRVKLEGALKDLCRIGWGKVIKVQSSKLKIKSRPLILAGRIRLGEEVEKEIDWEKALVPKIKEGDWVSFHWSQVCDLLSKEDVSHLECYTERTFHLLPLAIHY